MLHVCLCPIPVLCWEQLTEASLLRLNLAIQFQLQEKYYVDLGTSRLTEILKIT